MKRRRIIAPLCLALALTFIACGNNKKSDENNEKLKKDSTISVQEEDIPENARYGFKSGLVVLEAKKLGMKQKIEIWFDNFGEINCTNATSSMLGQEVKLKTILANDTLYNINLTENTGSFKPVEKGGVEKINFRNLTEGMKEEYNITSKGQTEVLGYTCDIYEIEVPNQGMSGTYYVYKGITLKTEVSAKGLPMTFTASKFEENVEIPEGTFDIPQDIEFVEEIIPEV